MHKQFERVTVELGSPAQVVVVADSHSQPHPRAREWIARERPDAILHAGDIGKLSVIDELEDIAPTYAVRGNVDGHGPDTPDDLVVHFVNDGRRLLGILLTHIAVYGPRLRKDAREKARRHGVQLVVCGHSHVPLIAREGELSVFNPGSFGPRRFQLPITFGVLDFVGGRLELRHVDCETGETWLPPGL